MHRHQSELFVDSLFKREVHELWPPFTNYKQTTQNSMPMCLVNPPELSVYMVCHHTAKMFFNGCWIFLLKLWWWQWM